MARNRKQGKRGAARIAKIAATQGPASLSEDQIKQVWHQLKPEFGLIIAAERAARSRRRDFMKKARPYRFTWAQFKLAARLDTPEGEKAIMKDIMQTLRIARWEDHPIGAQLDMFERNASGLRPPTEIAYDQGRTASMKNQPRKPPYVAQTEAYDLWMEGYADHQHELAQQFKAPTDGAARRGVARKGQGRKRRSLREVEPMPQVGLTADQLATV